MPSASSPTTRVTKRSLSFATSWQFQWELPTPSFPMHPFAFEIVVERAAEGLGNGVRFLYLTSIMPWVSSERQCVEDFLEAQIHFNIVSNHWLFFEDQGFSYWGQNSERLGEKNPVT
ncbi:unnamed protein product [Allacma fusca]|uniref:Uncharacterized protein n=1 Tax=Allacma fusca TaxID=39272 RepID=A0A8J2PPF3_9HEXA|nr:unnamed protein product [Allacma fusca]